MLSRGLAGLVVLFLLVVSTGKTAGEVFTGQGQLMTPGSEVTVSSQAVTLPGGGDKVSSPGKKADNLLQEEQKSWWKDRRRGWYWKEEPPTVTSPPKEAEKKPEKPEYIPVLKRYTYKDLWNMHPEEYAKLMKESLNRAIQTLSVDDVKEYLILQDIATRKAKAYSAVAGYVVATNPDLNMEKDFPITYGGRVAYLKEQAKDLREYILSNSQNYAILYFSKQGCPYCSVMDGVTKRFLDRYPGWIIKKLDIHEYPSLAERFNVTVTPTLIMVKKGSEDWLPVAFGAMSLGALEESVYRTLRLLNKEITPEEWWTMRFQEGGSFDPLLYIKQSERRKL
jgi:conjugal transfer pilus assembly protein TraF